MKSITFTKSSTPTFSVEVMVDIDDTVAAMQEDGYERKCTIMECKNLTDDAISQGLDVTKKIDISYRGLIDMGKTIDDTSIEVVDYPSGARAIIHTP